MKIWVDADACPNVIKNILFRAANRTRVTVTLVANQPLNTPPSRYINSIQVPSGFDVADNLIVQKAEPDDLVVTADIPLAAAIVENGGYALNPRGEFYTEENIHSRLATRDLMAELRSSGVMTGGPSVLDKKDRQAFANALDRFLSH